MITFTQGQTLGPGDLSILPRDAGNNIVTPVSITYTIFAVPADGTPPVPVTTPNLDPASAQSGGFYVNSTIPFNWYGKFNLVWYLQQYANSPVEDVQMEFQVTGLESALSSFEAPSVLITPAPPIKPKYGPALVGVRKLLRDDNPDKNYHFRPPTSAKVVAGYTSRVGFIWTDEDILWNFEQAISEMNIWNEKTFYNYTLDTIPIDWSRVASVGAAAWCLLGESTRWAADEFGFSLNGISMDLHKKDTYLSLGTTFRQQFETIATKATAIRPFSAGLRQQRWLLG